MNKDALIGTALLFAVSVVVRIVPTFASIQLSERRSEEIKNILPIAVLINLMLYCVISESHHHRLAAAISFIILTFLIMLGRINLLLLVTLATATYLVTR
jgi:branched-subunit amino acid transport protein AzlD